jgi:hypothetical protein
MFRPRTSSTCFCVQAELADVRALEIPALETRHKEAAAHNRLLNELLMFNPNTSLMCCCVQAELTDVRALEIPALETRHKEATARVSSEVSQLKHCSCSVLKPH